MNILSAKQPAGLGPQITGHAALVSQVLRQFSRAASQDAILDGLRASPSDDPSLQILDAFRQFQINATPVSAQQIEREILPCLVIVQDGPALVIEDENGHLVMFTNGAFTACDLGTLRQVVAPQAWHLSMSQKTQRGVGERLRNINPLANLGGSKLVWILISALFSNVLGLATSLFVMVVYDRVLPNKAVESLYSLAIGVGLAVFLDGVLRKARATIVDRAGRDADLRVTEDIFDQFVAVSGGQTRKSVGELASVMRNYETYREFMTTATVLTFVDLPFVFLYIFVIWQVADLLFIVPLIAVPVVIIAALAAQPLMRRNARETTQISMSRQGLLVEILAGLEALRVTGAFALMKQRFLMQAGQQRSLAVHSRAFAAQIATLLSSVQQAVQVITIVLGFHLFAAGSITMGAIIAAVILSGRAMAPLAKVGQAMGRANMALSAYRSVAQFLSMDRTATNTNSNRQLGAAAAAIDISNVTLRLDAKAAPIFAGMSLRIKRGERVAVVGRTGSGKSSLLRLINGLSQPEAGLVLIGGLPVESIARSDMPAIIGTVFQQPWLFGGTLRDNVGLGRPNIDDAAILRALQTVGLTGDSAASALSLDLTIAEQGVNLSGGQRQAITVARALVASPEIFLMDEPSSAMDSQLEALLIDQIQTQLQGKTLIMVTHKAKLLELCDRVILLDKGQIIRDIPMRDYIAATRPQQLSDPAMKVST